MGERLDSTGLTYFWGKIKSYISGKIIDDLTSSSSNAALSANQGRVLNTKLVPIDVFSGNGYALTYISNFTSMFTSMVNGGFSILRFAPNSTDAPNTGAGIVMTYKYSEKYGTQIAITDEGIKHRALNNGTWGAWTAP